jgi:hypothetical protein
MRPTNLLLAVLIIFVIKARAETLTFIAQLTDDGVMNYSWFSANNWFVSGPSQQSLIHAGRIPTPDDDVFLQTDVNAAADNAIVINAMTAAGTVSGGSFYVRTLGMLDNSAFQKSTVHVTSSMATDGRAYIYGGVLNIDAGATAIISYQAPKTSGALFIGEFGDPFALDKSGVVNNQGAVVLKKDTTLGAIGSGVFINQPNAEMRASDTAQISGVGASFTFDNRGTVRVETGTLSIDTINWTGGTGGGAFQTTALDAAIHYRNSIFTIPDTVTFTFKGAGKHLFTDGGLKVSGQMNVGMRDAATGFVDPGHVELAATIGESSNGNIRVIADATNASSFTWTSGHLGVLRDFVIDRYAEFLVAGSGGNGTSYFDLGHIRNSGVTRITGTAGLTLGGQSRFYNLPTGKFEMTTDAVISGDGTSTLFQNEGIFLKNGGASRTEISTPFANYGIVEATVGSFNFQNGLEQRAGVLSITHGQTLGVGTGFLIFGGKVVGDGTISGRVLNSGLISPGATPGILTIDSSETCVQDRTGVVEIKIGGPNPGTDHDQVVFTSAVVLGGALNIKMINGYRPAPGDTFKVLRYLTQAGTFPIINGGNLGDGLYLKPVYTDTELDLVATVGAISPPLLINYTAAGAEISFPTQVGEAYQVEMSNDLSQWDVLLKFVADSSTETMIDTTVGVQPIHFYRVH